MKITFILPFTRITGGVRAILEHANHLHERGHSVSIVYPLFPLSFGEKWFEIKKKVLQWLRFLGDLKTGNRVRWFAVKAKLIRVPNLSERYIPDADIVVVVTWPTAYYIQSYHERKGKKVYFIQHYEVDDGPKEMVDATYRLPLYQITKADLTRQLLKEQFNREVLAVIPNGVNLSVFYNDRKVFNKTPRILMYYSRNPRKGAKTGIEALVKVKGRFPKTEYIMYGVRKGKDVPGYVKFVKSSSDERLRELYGSCDIFVYPSNYEGFGLPPMEAMACKCAVVSTRVGAVPDYTIPGKTALVSPPEKPELLARNIISLLEDKNELKRISMAGYNYIKRFSWEGPTIELERVFESLMNNKKFNSSKERGE